MQPQNHSAQIVIRLDPPVSHSQIPEALFFLYSLIIPFQHLVQRLIPKHLVFRVADQGKLRRKLRLMDVVLQDRLAKGVDS